MRSSSTTRAAQRHDTGAMHQRSSMETRHMHAQRPSIAAVAHDLPGQSVVLADGDDLGVITDVVETPDASGGVPAHALVIDIDHETTNTPSDPLVISGESVLAVTDDAVVL